MKYRGTELKEFTSKKPVVFDPPREMLVWDNHTEIPAQTFVHAYIPQVSLSVITDIGNFAHCAEIPEAPKSRRATNLELAKWLAQGNGLCTHSSTISVWTFTEIAEDILDDECNPEWHIRKWNDKEWHEPTADYMGLEG